MITVKRGLIQCMFVWVASLVVQQPTIGYLTVGVLPQRFRSGGVGELRAADPSYPTATAWGYERTSLMPAGHL